MRRPADPIAQSVALSLLSRGIGSPGEIAGMAGVSRQLVESWAKSAGIDWKAIKRERFGHIWFREIQRGYALQRKVRRRRPRMRQPSGPGLPRCADEEALADPLQEMPAQSRGVDDEEPTGCRAVQVQQMR